MQVGRNEPCPCGSGSKYKNCCAGKEAQTGLPRGLVLLVVAIAAIAALGFLPLVLNRGDERPTARAVAPPAPVATQPSGPAPAGKVWSKEHGHWHDANPSAAASPIKVETSQGMTVSEGAGSVNVTGTLPAQQESPATAGKIWSPEHGHWHDAAKAAAKNIERGLPPAVPPAPPRPGTMRVLGREVPLTQPQPAGPAPAGKVWSPEHGHWHDAPKQ